MKKKFNPARDIDPEIARVVIKGFRSFTTYEALARESGVGLSTIKQAASPEVRYPLTKEDFQLIIEAADRIKNGISKSKDDDKLKEEVAYRVIIDRNFRDLSLEQKRMLSEFSVFVKVLVP